jgi:hypothetical protein
MFLDELSKIIAAIPLVWQDRETFAKAFVLNIVLITAIF